MKKQKGVVVVCMGRCCGPNDLENMHPAQQSSAATMRAVTAAVLADAASVLADAASALADTASALADTTQKFIQAQICVCCKYRSVFVSNHVTFTNTALYLQTTAGVLANFLVHMAN